MAIKLGDLSDQERSMLASMKGKTLGQLSDNEKQFLSAIKMKYGEQPQSMGSAALQAAGYALDTPGRLGEAAGEKIAELSGAEEGSLGDKVGKIGGRITGEIAALAAPASAIGKLAKVPGALQKGLAAIKGVKGGKAALAVGRGALEASALDAVRQAAETGEIDPTQAGIAAAAGGGLAGAGQGIRAGAGKVLEKAGALRKATTEKVTGEGGREFVKGVRQAMSSGEGAAGKLAGDIGDELTAGVTAARSQAGQAFRSALEKAQNEGPAVKGVEGVLRASLKKLGLDLPKRVRRDASGKVTIELSRKAGLGSGSVVPEADMAIIKEGLEKFYESRLAAAGRRTASGKFGPARLTPTEVDNLQRIFQAVQTHNRAPQSLRRIQPGEVRAAKARQSEVEEAANLAQRYGAEPPADALVDKSALSTTAATKSAANALNDPIRAAKVTDELMGLLDTLGIARTGQKMKDLSAALQVLKFMQGAKLGSQSQLVSYLANTTLLPLATPFSGPWSVVPLAASLLGSRAGEVEKSLDNQKGGE